MNKRQAILDRIAEILEGIPDVLVERNTTEEFEEQLDPVLVLHDGLERTSPPENARFPMSFMRWEMEPQIEVFVSVRDSIAPDAELNGLYQGILSRLIKDQPLASLLSKDRTIAAEYNPVYTKDQPFAGFVLGLTLTYDKSF